METQNFEGRYHQVHRRANEALAVSDFTLTYYGELALSDAQLSLGAFAARVCAFEPTPEQEQLLRQPQDAASTALYLVLPGSHSERD